MNSADTPYDLLIIGAGVSGTALLYLCSKYTNIKKIGLIEKYAEPATVNSRPCQNSQTLHCGDIETNYSLEKAHQVRRATDMLRRYATTQPNADELIFKYPKMVLGVGKKECDLLRARYEEFSPYYPNLKLMKYHDIDKIEPRVTFGRDEEIVALGSTDEYSAVDFEELSYSFIDNAELQDKEIDVLFNKHITGISKASKGEQLFYVFSDVENIHYRARSVVVCAGSHSLLLAHYMKRGLHYSVLPVAGSYYFTPTMLNGKVYTVQNDALPFAAVHGDPDVHLPNVTRFGPTALVLPLLERYNWKTMREFFRVFRFDKQVAKALWNSFRVKDIRNYMLKNMLYEIPLIRKLLFLREARKIVPSLKLKQLTFAKKFGGLRPQLIDKERGEIMMGEAKFDEGDGIIFNMTPSPGGTSCIDNAERDMLSIVKYLNATFDEESFKRELENDTY